MHNRFDQLGKKIGLEALGPSGVTVVHDELSPDARHADLRHEPDPERQAERARLGLLGRMASMVCLIEIYSGSPDEEETLTCLGKLIAFRQKRRRDAGKRGKRQRERGGSPSRASERPFVWILSAGRPTTALLALSAVRARGWPRGVYVSPGVLLAPDGAPLDGVAGLGGLLRLGIVVASELPRDRSTILVRLMAAGQVLRGALEDLAELPDDAHEHALASDILPGLRHALAKKTELTAEEQELMEDWKAIGRRISEKLRKEGRKEGRDEGRLVQARAAVRRVLTARELAVSAAEQAQIDACNDLATLERWLDQALTASSTAEALGVPTRRKTARSGARLHR
jgi:hypothetical protein